MGRMAYAISDLAALKFARRRRRGVVLIQSPLIPPDANAGSGFKLQLFQNMLHVFLDGAWTAFENFSDLVVTLSGDDPFYDLEFASGQIRRLSLGYA